MLGSSLARIGVPVVGAGSALLAACGNSLTAPTIVTLFSPNRVLAAGRPQRIPFALVSPDAGNPDGVALPEDDGTVDVAIRFDGTVVLETEVAGRVVNHDHVGEPDPDHQHANLFRYYPLRATLDEPGIYDLTITVEGTTTELPIQMFDASEVGVPLVGDPFPSLVTPTLDEPDGIDQICTRFEPCSFHQLSAADGLAAGRAMAILIATPAFCSTAYCGPVLDTMIEASAAHPDIEFIHVEFYQNPDEVDGNFRDPRIRVANAVAALGLEFEPSLFLVSSEGTLVDRIDNVFDGSELSAALDALSR